MWVKSHRDLDVYKRGFELAGRIFTLSKGFPKEETYSLTDQIRRSSRSICANIAEAWGKRRYEAMFVSKLDAYAELLETQTWLDFAIACSYCKPKDIEVLDQEYLRLAQSLTAIIEHAPEWCKVQPPKRQSNGRAAVKR